MLVRMIRRRSIVETSDAEEILKVAFSDENDQPDLKLSTYESERDRLVQLRTEHCAGASNERPSAYGHLDVTGLHSRLQATSGNEWFAYADGAHRELQFQNKDELLDFIQKIQQSNCQCHDVTNSECKQYLKNVAATREWQHFFDCHENGPRWRQLAGG